MMTTRLVSVQPRLAAIIAGLTALMLLAALSAPAQAQAAADEWSQIGDDIDGDAVEQDLGRSVALSADGSRMAVGAPAAGGPPAVGPGTVRVYERTSSGWVQLGLDIDGEEDSDESGTSVAISADGNRVAIGAPFNGASPNFSHGHVRVYEWTGTEWDQVGEDIDGENGGDLSGMAVSLAADGNRVAIGAPYNSDIGPLAGQVRVFDLVGGQWVQVGDDINTTDPFDEFGTSVSISADGTRVAIGAPQERVARVFDLLGTSWVQVGDDLNGDSQGDEFGTSVAISGDGSRVIVGAPGASTPNGDFSGEARAFELAGNTWAQVGGDINGEFEGDFSGTSVAISADGETVVVGAPLNDGGNGDRVGHASVFAFNSVVDSWQIVGRDIDGEADVDISGTSVAMSASGTIVAVGAPQNDDGASNAGQVRVFQREICDGLVVDVYLGNGDLPTAGDDVILGTNGNDLIVAGAGDDTVCSLGGDDTVNAGPGNDLVDAGDGDDTVFGLGGNDVLVGAAGNDELLGQDNNDILNGGDGNDTLNGGPGFDALFGLDGADTLFGLDGADDLLGGNGNDILFGQGGDDNIRGNAGDDRINAGTGNDIVTGGLGNDNVFGLSGNDDLNGGDGVDFVHGFDGDDTLNGGAGDDLVLGTAGNDTFNEFAGTNTLNGGPGNDIINGGTGPDTIFGDGNLTQAGNDTIRGGNGIDLIISFSGDDTITTNDDGVPDTVNAGPHNTGDTCFFTAGIDTIFNCNP